MDHFQRVTAENVSRGELLKGLRLQEGRLNHCVYAHDSRGCVSILASSGIGAAHLVVFAGFSAQSLKDRIADVQSALVVTANESLRGKKVMALKSIIDAAITDLPFLTTCLVFRRTDVETARIPVRDVWANKKVTVRPYFFRKGLLVHVVHLWFHHGRVSYVDVAHGEDCFQSVRGTAMTPSRTLTGSLATPTSSADPSRTDVPPSCSSRCPRENLGATGT